MKMTFEEIKESLEKAGNWDDFYLGQLLQKYDHFNGLSDEIKSQLGTITKVSDNLSLVSEMLESVEEFYGNVPVWVVYYFEDHDVYIKVSGYTTSYEDNCYFEDMKEVSPTTKTITVYQ